VIEIPIGKATELISPRLTVLVNTIDETGELNSSPYSWVYPLSTYPPLIGVGIGGKHKFTYVNSMRTGEFVVCVVSEAFGQQAVNCEAAHRPGSKLWEKHGLHAGRSTKVKVPRILESNAILECRVKQFIELPADHLILVGEVLHAEVKQTGLDNIKPLLHDGADRFRTIGEQVILERRQQ
jgi:flavin reductase (DIM6/NTAB) family NADH-FMN oxidoreductase RutF